MKRLETLRVKDVQICYSMRDIYIISLVLSLTIWHLTDLTRHQSSPSTHNFSAIEVKWVLSVKLAPKMQTIITSCRSEFILALKALKKHNVWPEILGYHNFLLDWLLSSKFYH